VYPRPEAKFFDQVTTTTSIPQTGLVSILNIIPQGLTGSARIGQQVATKSCYYQYIVRLGSTATPTGIRFILLWDRQSDGAGAAPVITDILAQASPTSPMNLANRNRFVVLADDRTTLSPNGDMIQFVNGYRKINQLSTYVDGTFQPNTGSLLLLTISDQTVSANEPTFTGNWRVRFMDN